jgi:hypothetical protein
MNAFATFDDLDRFRQNLDEGVILRSASARTGKTVFLAHSSKDERYLAGVISVLENHGGKVYIDKADSRLPESTNRDTAEILRSTIRECHRFVLFVTTNSKESKWVPWELGIADGEKGHNPIALFPAAKSSDEQQWAQQEYLGLYRRVVWGKLEGWTAPGWFVLDHLQNTGTPLKKWLSGE